MDLISTAVATLAGLCLPAKATGIGLAVALGATGGVAAVAADQSEADTGVVEVADPTPEPTADPTAPTGDPAEDGTEDDGAESGEEHDAESGESGEDRESGADGEERELPEAAAFGQSVAADARDGGVDGQEIRERAHERNQERRADAVAPDDADPSAGDESTSSEPVTVAPAPSRAGAPAQHAPGQGRRP